MPPYGPCRWQRVSLTTRLPSPRARSADTCQRTGRSNRQASRPVPCSSHLWRLTDSCRTSDRRSHTQCQIGARSYRRERQRDWPHLPCHRCGHVYRQGARVAPRQSDPAFAAAGLVSRFGWYDPLVGRHRMDVLHDAAIAIGGCLTIVFCGCCDTGHAPARARAGMPPDPDTSVIARPSRGPGRSGLFEVVCAVSMNRAVAETPL